MGLIAFFGVKTNALVELLPNDNVKEYEFSGISITHSYTAYDFGGGSIEEYETFTNNFDNDNYKFISTGYNVTFQLVVEASTMPSDYNTDFYLYINGVQFITFNGDFFVSSLGQNKYSIILIDTASPDWLGQVTLTKNNYYNLSIQTDWAWFSYNVISADLRIDIYTNPIYQLWYEEGFLEGKDYGYDLGYEGGREDFGQYFPPGSPNGFNGWYGFQDGYDYGWDLGYNKAFEDNENFNFTSLLAQVFMGLGSLLAIELLPGISIGAVIAVPIVFGIIAFIIGKRGGKDD